MKLYIKIILVAMIAFGALIIISCSSMTVGGYYGVSVHYGSSWGRHDHHHHHRPPPSRPPQRPPQRPVKPRPLPAKIR
jgi:hypothetical protein